MTIVAFDGKTIAADGLASDGGIVASKDVQKLAVVDNCVIGSGGCHWSALKFIDWWKKGKVDPYPVLDEAFCALVVHSDGNAELYGCKFDVGIPLGQRPYVIGCGRDIARGAMAMGADAKRAVEICCELDTACGGDIMVVTLEELRQAQIPETIRESEEVLA